MGKSKHSQIKHADKFHEALTTFWTKLDPYIWPVGIGMGIVLLLIGLGLLVGSRGSSAEKPWAELFRIRDTYMPKGEEASVLEFDQNARLYVQKLTDLTERYRRRPVAAVALLDLAQACSGLGGGLRERATVTPNVPKEEAKQNEEAARDLFTKAAVAAERFIADFPHHTLLPLAYYEAGKSRYELADYERAGDHFEQARARFNIAYPKTLAAYHAGRSFERTGDLSKARLAYQAAREEKLGGWCAELAEFRLAQLGGRTAPQSP